MAVDIWMQHPTQRFLRHGMFESLRRWTGGALPEDEIPIDAMDAGGVSFGLLSAWHASEGALISNDEVAGWVAAHQDRLGGVAAVDLRDPVRAVRELRRCVTELRFKGLRVIPWLWGLPPNDRRYYPLYSECVELGVPFCTQVGHTRPLRTSETGRRSRSVLSMDAPDGFAPFDPQGPFLEHIGPVLVRDDPDGRVFGLRVEERHTNHRGTVQGGLLSTFVDFALGRAIEADADDGKDRATVSLTVDFLKPAEPGDWIETRTRVERVGGTLAFADCALTVGGREIVRGRAVWVVAS